MRSAGAEPARIPGVDRDHDPGVAMGPSRSGMYTARASADVAMPSPAIWPSRAPAVAAASRPASPDDGGPIAGRVRPAGAADRPGPDHRDA